MGKKEKKTKTVKMGNIVLGAVLLCGICLVGCAAEKKGSGVVMRTASFWQQDNISGAFAAL